MDMAKIKSTDLTGGGLPEVPPPAPRPQQPTDPKVSQAASALGKQARGVPKTLTDAERQRRADAMREVGKANRKTVTIRGLKFTPASQPGRRERSQAGPRVLPQARGPIALVRGQAAQVVNQASRRAAQKNR